MPVLENYFLNSDMVFKVSQLSQKLTMKCVWNTGISAKACLLTGEAQTMVLANGQNPAFFIPTIALAKHRI